MMEKGNEIGRVSMMVVVVHEEIKNVIDYPFLLFDEDGDDNLMKEKDAVLMMDVCHDILEFDGLVRHQ